MSVRVCSYINTTGRIFPSCIVVRDPVTRTYWDTDGNCTNITDFCTNTCRNDSTADQMSCPSYARFAPIDVGTAGGLLTMACSLAVLITYALFPACRRHPAPLVWWIAVCDLFFGLRFSILLRTDILLPNEILFRSEFDWCGLLGMATHFLLTASEGWCLTISFDRFMALQNPFLDVKWVKRMYHLFVWTASTLFTLLLHKLTEWDGNYDTQLNLCWICDTNGPINPRKILGFYVPMAVYYGATVYITWYVRKELGKGAAISATRREVLRYQGEYVLWMIIYWFVYFALNVGLEVTPEPCSGSRLQCNASAADEWSGAASCGANGSDSSIYVKSWLSSIQLFVFSARGAVHCALWFRGNWSGLAWSTPVSNLDLSPQMNATLREEVSRPRLGLASRRMPCLNSPHSRAVRAHSRAHAEAAGARGRRWSRAYRRACPKQCTCSRRTRVSTTSLPT